MTERRPISPDESAAISAMRCVSYPVGSWDKRFMRELASASQISEKQVAQLWRLFVRYRRQVEHADKARLMDLALSLAAPDLRKVEAARKEQARVDQMKQEVRA